MADAPYLIALALLDQQGQRAMPLQGRSLPQAVAADGDPGEEGYRQALELLLRVWQRSEEAPLRRAGGELSLLLVEVPLEALQVELPAIKARWLNSGNTTLLLSDLAALGGGLWSLELEPRQPPQYRSIQP
jgi:hypothetical protein